MMLRFYTVEHNAGGTPLFLMRHVEHGGPATTFDWRLAGKFHAGWLADAWREEVGLPKTKWKVKRHMVDDFTGGPDPQDLADCDEDGLDDPPAGTIE